MQKTGKIITIGLTGILALGALVYSQLSYKTCWNCNADDYFERGSEYICKENKSYRQTGLEFLEKSASWGHTQAELTLAELYSDHLPEGYTPSASEQTTCLRKDVSQNQETGLSYFKSVLGGVRNGKDVNTVTLDNLVLLYSDNFFADNAMSDKAVWLYEKAATAGSYPAMTILGNLYHTNGQYEKALHWFSKAAENTTDFQSALMLGDYYLYAKGTGVDNQKAQDWYTVAYARAKKSKTADAEVRRKIKKLASARLDMVTRKLEEPDNSKQQVAVRYSLEGNVKHFIIFAADHPGESIGEVFNDNGNFYATVNENLSFSDLLMEPRKDNFSSMVEGMQWVLNFFAVNVHDNSSAMTFDFVLTDS